MSNTAVAKGSTVEVSSEDPGFHGAWYVATLLDQVQDSPSKKKSSNNKKTRTSNQTRYLVKYDTLINDEPLTEILNPTSVRPLPPRNLRRNNVNYAMGAAAAGGEDFEVYDVIDAYHREGWWIGVVNKVINVAGTRKYVVAFENPPEKVEFGRSQLRLHVDWIDGRWHFPPKKIPENKLVERNAKRASESNNDADSPTVGPQPASVTKTRLRKATEKSSEMVVGAVKDSDSSRRNKGSKGNKKSKSDAVHQDSPITEHEMNNITTTPDAQTTDVDNSTVAPQPSSITKSRARKNNEKSSETAGVVKASDPSAGVENSGNKGNTKAKASVMEKSTPDAVHQDSPLMEHETNRTTTTPDAQTTDVDNPTVAPQPSSITKSRARKNNERSSETVGVVKASDPSTGNKGNTKAKASVMEKSTPDALHQDSPLMEHETNRTTTTTDALTVVDNPTVAPQPSAITKSRARKNCERSSETVGAVKASDHSAGSQGNTKAKASVMEKGKSDVHQDSPLMEHETSSTTTEICEAEDGHSPQKKRGRPPRLLAKEPTSLQQGGPEITVDLDDQPLSQLAGLNRSSCSRPDHHDEPPSQPTVTSPGPNNRDEPLNQATGTGVRTVETAGTTTDYQQDWPFIKRSPIWATIASLEMYQTPPQRPHFSPLKKIKANHREGLAIAHVVTFGNLVQMLSNLQLTDPVDLINNSLEILTDLETHGFDVGAIRGRLNKFLSLKSQASQHTIKLKKFEEELEKCNGEKCVEDKEINELEMKIKELQEKMVQKVAMKKVREKEIMGLQSNMNLVSEQISDCELAFKKLAATPF